MRFPLWCILHRLDSNACAQSEPKLLSDQLFGITGFLDGSPYAQGEHCAGKCTTCSSISVARSKVEFVCVCVVWCVCVCCLFAPDPLPGHEQTICPDYELLMAAHHSLSCHGSPTQREKTLKKNKTLHEHFVSLCSPNVMREPDNTHH